MAELEQTMHNLLVEVKTMNANLERLDETLKGLIPAYDKFWRGFYVPRGKKA